MSQENVEIVRRSLEAYAAGNVEEMLRYVDPQGELHSAIIGGAEGKVFRGHDGFRSGSPKRRKASKNSAPN